MFRIGTPVFLRNRASQDAPGMGTIVNVIPSDSGLDHLARYDVDFASGLQTLHGSELRPVRMGIPPVMKRKDSCTRRHSTSICEECENWPALPR